MGPGPPAARDSPCVPLSVSGPRSCVPWSRPQASPLVPVEQVAGRVRCAEPRPPPNAITVGAVHAGADDGVVVTGEALVDLVLNPEGAIAAHPGGGPYNVART